jgi:hypothetical protein
VRRRFPAERGNPPCWRLLAPWQLYRVGGDRFPLSALCGRQDGVAEPRHGPRRATPATREDVPPVAARSEAAALPRYQLPVDCACYQVVTVLAQPRPTIRQLYGLAGHSAGTPGARSAARVKPNAARYRSKPMVPKKKPPTLDSTAEAGRVLVMPRQLRAACQAKATRFRALTNAFASVTCDAVTLGSDATGSLPSRQKPLKRARAKVIQAFLAILDQWAGPTPVNRKRPAPPIQRHDGNPGSRATFSRHCVTILPTVSADTP